MSDPRDLSIFGRVWVENNITSVGTGPTETDLRRNLATFAHAHGWLVQEEVVVPGWGRIDLIVEDGTHAARLVELKLDLIKPARIRRAFQQADGYCRWWTHTFGRPVNVSLIGVRLDKQACLPALTAYPSVSCGDVPSLLSLLRYTGDKDIRGFRVAERLRRVDRVAEVYRNALGYLTPAPPVTPWPAGAAHSPPAGPGTNDRPVDQEAAPASTLSAHDPRADGESPTGFAAGGAGATPTNSGRAS